MRHLRGFLAASLAIAVVSGCGGGGGGGGSGGGGSGPPPPLPNPAPTIAAISPVSADQGGTGFTLSVIGSNFVSGSQISWRGAALTTTFVNGQLLTAAIPASDFLTAGPDTVAVITPGPGGGTSGSLNLSVPCPLPTVAPASTQTKARVGAYYFDGWSGPLTNFHFNGLPLGPYQSRQPTAGWQDITPCAVEQQLATAHNFGIDFLVFDWYFNTAVNDPGENLNSALEITHELANRHGMQFAILYVDSPPFDVSPANWNTAVTEWMGYMTDPAYARINGLPAFFIINVGEMEQIFGSSGAVSAALAQLRSAAKAQGLPGVYIVGGFGAPDGTIGQDTLGSGFATAQADGYDAVAFYNYPFAPPAINGMLPFSTLVQAGEWTWSEAVKHNGLPFIPTAMAGWDPRPWNETESATGDLMYYSRTPQEFAAFVSDAVAWANANPALRPEAAPTPPLVLIEAWNEFGEGSHMLPTVGDGTSYGDALAAMLTEPATHFSVTAPTSTQPGARFNFIVTARDAANNLAGSYTGTVHFSSTDARAILPAGSTLTDGMGIFPATLSTTGSQTIAATDTVTGSITGTSNAIDVFFTPYCQPKGAECYAAPGHGCCAGLTCVALGNRHYCE